MVAVAPPIVFEPGRIPREARQRGKIGRKKRTGELFQYGRTRDQALRAVREFPDDKVAVFKRRKAHPDRKVESFADHVDTTVGAFEQHFDLRTFLHESGNHLADLEVDQR
jgi:hypothetical protein